MLRELGFVVNASTSVELGLVPDAWYRGAWMGVLGIALATGLLLTIVERLVSIGVERTPDRLLLPVMMAPTVPVLALQDYLGGFRTILLNGLVCSVILLTLWMVRLRRGAPMDGLAVHARLRVTGVAGAAQAAETELAEAVAAGTLRRGEKR
jgi:hypothetical protein